MSAELIRADGLPAIEVFAYSLIPPAPPLCWDGLLLGEPESSGTPVQPSAPDPLSGSSIASEGSVIEQRLAEECARSYDAGREKGFEEGRVAGQLLATQTERREALDRAAGLVENFARQQSHYFESIEPEVVRLALAIAVRILRREAQMDPLVLTGAVRVALGQIAACSRVRLLVPSTELDLWTEAMALLPNLPLKPVVVAGEGLQLGDCRLESDLGSVDLSISAQLTEIERSLFDVSRAARYGDSHSLAGATGVVS
jgi:flagellar assembly protein FliH